MAISSTAQKTTKCSRCRSAISDDPPYCPNCGCEFASGKDAVGPFSFAFPNVDDAYKPSGKGGKFANALMLTMGLLAAIVGGVLLPRVQDMLGRLVASLVRSLSIFDGLQALLGFVIWGVILTLAFGFAIGFAVFFGAFIGKSRSDKTASRIGLVCGLAGYVTYLVTLFTIDGMKVFDSFIDVIGLIISFLAIVLPAWLIPFVAAHRKFCEACETHMYMKAFPEIPIRHEITLMEAFGVRAFDVLPSLYDKLSEGDKNYSQVTYWYCNSCEKQGFVNVVTTQARYKNEVKDGKETTTWQTQGRLIFSSPITESEIKTLLEVGGG